MSKVTMKIEKAKAEEHAKPVPANRKEADRITADIKAKFKKGERIWWDIAKDINAGLQRHAHTARNQTVKEWVSELVDGSLSDAFRNLRRFRKLQGIPKLQLETISGKNLDQLTRLTEQDRKSPAWISRAQDLAPAELEKCVDEVLEKRGVPKVEYFPWGLRLTKEELEESADCENKMAGVMEIDTDQELSMADRRKIWAAVRSLVLTTENEHLVTELQGR